MLSVAGYLTIVAYVTGLLRDDAAGSFLYGCQSGGSIGASARPYDAEPFHVGKFLRRRRW
jgi:hypothetical protein